MISRALWPTTLPFVLANSLPSPWLPQSDVHQTLPSLGKGQRTPEFQIPHSKKRGGCHQILELQDVRTPYLHESQHTLALLQPQTMNASG